MNPHPDGPTRTDPLIDLAMSMLSEQFPNLIEMTISIVRTCVSQFVRNEIPLESARQVISEAIGSDEIILRLNEVLTISDVPLPEQHLRESAYLLHNGRKKTHPWTHQEDTRLIAAMHKYSSTETYFWSSVAQFVGNGRTRSQCSQRWIRVLDPRISKQQWTPEEDDLLLKLVAKYGEKAWMKVSGDLKQRSDVQCRYRYTQLQKLLQEVKQRTAVTKVEEAPGKDPFEIEPQFDINDGLHIPLTASLNVNRSDTLFDSRTWLFKSGE
jgi:hypothetical protein